jgi:hypothetical protein
MHRVDADHCSDRQMNDYVGHGPDQIFSSRSGPNISSATSDVDRVRPWQPVAEQAKFLLSGPRLPGKGALLTAGAQKKASAAAAKVCRCRPLINAIISVYRCYYLSVYGSI